MIIGTDRWLINLGLRNRNLSDKDGYETTQHTLTIDEMPIHSHIDKGDLHDSWDGKCFITNTGRSSKYYATIYCVK